MQLAGRKRKTAIALGILLACCPGVYALNPSLDISQYAHKSWTVRDGYFPGRITAIAQTSDGYLWVGTEFGLMRFDGVRSVPWEPPAGQHLPSSSIRSLLGARDGRLWIGTDKGLATWKDGKLTQYQALTGWGFVHVIEDRGGKIWASGYEGKAGRLCAIQNGGVQCYGQDGSFGQSPRYPYEDSKGNLWVAAGSQGLWQWEPSPPKFYGMPETVQAMAEGDSGELLIATPSGMRRLLGDKAEAYSLPGAPRSFPTSAMLRDRDGSLWIGTYDRGLLHVHEGRTDLFAQVNGLSGDFVYPLFEDREGNIWVATTDGLDRFHDLAVSTISAKQGLSNSTVLSVLAARDGSVWLGTKRGLNVWQAGQVTIYRKQNSALPDDSVESLFQDDKGRIWIATLGGVAYFENGKLFPVNKLPGGIWTAIAGDKAGNLWISEWAGANDSLFHLRADGSVERIPWSKFGHNDTARTLVTDPIRGGLWLGFQYGGVVYFKDGEVRASYSAGDGLGEGYVADLQLDRDGTLWAATAGGLSRIKDGHVTTLSRRNGLPCDNVHWMRDDDDHSVWLYTACGLVRVARRELDAWAADSRQAIHHAVFGSSDGVRSNSTTTGYSPSVAKSADGKIWFLPFDGVSVIDPRHIPVNKLPPPVHIEQITANRTPYSASANLRLPKLIHDLTIDYTALSMVVPEKVHFRFKLEPQDKEWREVINERHVEYSNLGPGRYRFRVTACNNSGVWNEAGDTLDFSIAPAYYQTNWFLALCGAAFLAFLWSLYQLRLHQMAREFNSGLEARVNERTRIARDLHDTLLQSFHGLMLHFKAVSNQLPDGSEPKQRLDRAIKQAAQAITEGRDAVQQLRTSTVLTNDLAASVGTLGKELEAQYPAVFQVVVEGAPRDLHPILRDEVYRIAGEALRNAFRHAAATRIEVEIRYDEKQFRLRVRDDGKGIDPKIVQDPALVGHFGLSGMRERAKLIGGKLEVWSEVDSGTEVQLDIAASIAYTKS